MMTVISYTMNRGTLTMPGDAWVMDCMYIGADLVFFAEVPEEPEPDVTVPVRIISTGHPVPAGMTHFRTILHGGKFIRHVYLPTLDEDEDE